MVSVQTISFVLSHLLPITPPHHMPTSVAEKNPPFSFEEFKARVPPGKIASPGFPSIRLPLNGRRLNCLLPVSKTGTSLTGYFYLPLARESLLPLQFGKNIDNCLKFDRFI